MPESKNRTKPAFTAPSVKSSGPRNSPRWYAPTFLTIMVLGVLYLCVYYLSGGSYPIKALENWNLVVGIGILMVGFAMTTRWR